MKEIKNGEKFKTRAKKRLFIKKLPEEYRFLVLTRHIIVDILCMYKKCIHRRHHGKLKNKEKYYFSIRIIH